MGLDGVIFAGPPRRQVLTGFWSWAFLFARPPLCLSSHFWAPNKCLELPRAFSDRQVLIFNLRKPPCCDRRFDMNHTITMYLQELFTLIFLTVLYRDYHRGVVESRLRTVGIRRSIPMYFVLRGLGRLGFKGGYCKKIGMFRSS